VLTQGKYCFIHFTLILGRITISPHHVNPHRIGSETVSVGFILTLEAMDYVRTHKTYLVVDTKTFYGRDLIPTPPPAPHVEVSTPINYSRNSRNSHTSSPNTSVPNNGTVTPNPPWVASGPVRRRAFYTKHGPLNLPPGWLVNRTKRKNHPTKVSITNMARLFLFQIWSAFFFFLFSFFF
jgi:hypothetical protein